MVLIPEEFYYLTMTVGMLCIPPAIVVILVAFFAPGTLRKNLIDGILIYGLVVSICAITAFPFAIIFALPLAGMVIYRMARRGQPEVIPGPKPEKKPREKPSSTFGGISPMDNSKRE